MKSSTLLIVAAVLLAGCSATSAASGPDAPASASATGPLVYVCNQDDATVSLIDSGTNEVIETVDLKQLGFGPNAKPHHVVVEPDGSYWYVSLIGENRVVKLDRSNRVVGVAEFDVPGMLALHPTDDVLLVGRSMTAVNPPERIGVIARSTMQVEELPVLFPRPHAIALNTTADVGYTASLAVNQLAAVNYGDEHVNLVPVPGQPAALMQFALSPDQRTLVITGEVSGELFVFDVSDPMRPQLVDRIDAGVQPFDPIFTKDGRWVYFGNKLADRVSVVDMNRRSVAKTIEHEGIRQPHGVAISPDGRYVYVSNNNLGAEAHRMMSADHAAHAGAQAQGEPGLGTVVVIDTATQQVVDVITVGRNASGIAIAQGQSR